VNTPGSAHIRETANVAPPDHDDRNRDVDSVRHRAGVWPLVTAAEMQALDRETIDQRGVPGEILMESAGRALVAPTLRLRAQAARPAGPVVVLAGAGNNGGDGFVVARHLLAEGIDVETVLVGDPERLPADAAANWKRLESVGGARRVTSPDTAGAAVDAVASLLAGASVAIDALFGTGLARPLAGGFASLVEAVNGARTRGLKVLAVDVPSGVSADTGAVLGAAIAADETVTISLPKVGLALEPGSTLAGCIRVARVGIADPDPARTPRAELWNARAAAARFPVRPRAGHKGSFGHVLVIAGSTGKCGAGALSCRAAARAGAGLVTLAHPIGLESELGALPVEVMSAPVAATDDGGFSLAGEKTALELAAARDVVALGPGVGTHADTVALVRRLAAAVDRPMVIDADGLNALVGALDGLHERAAATVLTPHPGEAARLLGVSAKEVNADRLASARRLAGESGSVVILKGARTVIAAPDGRALLTPTGGPALATGGTGDVLTGIVAALLAGGLEAFEAAGLAAWWHGAAADRLPVDAIGFGLLASEVANALPDTVVALRAELLGSGGEGERGDTLDLRFPGR